MDDQVKIKDQKSKIKNEKDENSSIDEASTAQPVEQSMEKSDASSQQPEATDAVEESKDLAPDAAKDTVDSIEEKVEDTPQEEKVAESDSVEETVTETTEEALEKASEAIEEKVEEKKAEDTPQEEAESDSVKDEFSDQAKLEGGTKSDLAKWYIVHTYSGHENKVAKNLKQRVQALGFENKIFDVIVPVRNTVKVTSGKKESVSEKIFPGYVLVKMILDNESWLLVRTTQGVTSFIGAGNKPTPISEKEVEVIQKFMNTEEPMYKTSFTVGEAIKIVDGPFADFLGTIDEIDEAKGKLKVLVSIFGRETPVELDFLQVNKL